MHNDIQFWLKLSFSRVYTSIEMRFLLKCKLGKTIISIRTVYVWCLGVNCVLVAHFSLGCSMLNISTELFMLCLQNYLSTMQTWGWSYSSFRINWSQVVPHFWYVTINTSPLLVMWLSLISCIRSVEKCLY